ncbi:hypothetical protein [Promicromonospora iranensis]|uniref:Uncharacterized protein n=1 Tax=Promicromonospora iranensis TaxID=1105144 RepID=A0ABU2CJ30_9MICO|nr:hypothetical protein [Promicromonospora iranensis]MDR7381339.1 hypothetical protein [Promicromonospora iranensis]
MRGPHAPDLSRISESLAEAIGAASQVGLRLDGSGRSPARTVDEIRSRPDETVA